MTGAAAVYAIDKKKLKTQVGELMPTLELVPTERAIETLFPARMKWIAKSDSHDVATAFLSAYANDPGSRPATLDDDQQQAVWAVTGTGRTLPAASFSLFRAWRGARGLIDLAFDGGRYEWDPGRRTLVTPGKPLTSWPLKHLVRFVVTHEPGERPHLLARADAASLSRSDRSSVAIYARDAERAGPLVDEWCEVGIGQVDAWEACALLGLIDDDARFERFVVALGAHARFVGRTAQPARAVERVSAAALARALVGLLDRGLTEKWKSAGVAPWAKALAHVRSPEVARVLAAWVGEKSVAKVADEYFRRHPDLAEAALGATAKGKGRAAPIARAILDALARVAPTAAPHAAPAKKAKKSRKGAAATGDDVRSTSPLPRVLVDPPWLAKKPIDRPRLALVPITDGERFVPTVTKYTKQPAPDRSPELDARHLAGRPPSQLYEMAIFSMTDDVAFESIATRENLGIWQVDAFHAWLGERTTPYVLAAIGRDLRSAYRKLESAVSSRLALPCAVAALARSGGAERAASIAWLRAHPEVAALGLIPAALGDDDLQADLAERALRLLLRAGEKDAVDRASERYGEAAVDALARLLARSPHERYPAKPPPRVKWAAGDRLGAMDLAAGGALTDDQTAALVTMLQFSPIGDPYIGVGETLPLLTAPARERAAKALFDEYVLAGSPPSHEWVLGAMALLAPSVAIPLLRDHMRRWAADGKVTLLHRSLEVLASIGTDDALVVVYDAGQRSRYDDTRDKVREILDDVASQRGIAYDVLEDLLVPELGLEHGPIALDLGGRTLTVRLGDHLEAVLHDPTGAALAAFPRKAKADDAEKYATAKAKHGALEDAAESVGRGQTLRFERALRDRRSWSVGELRANVLTQPLVRHLARRLVWQVVGSDTLFRVAEDDTLADANDEALAFPPSDARVVLAHPLASPGLSSFLRWIEDYRVIQPFPQVGRETFALEGDERRASSFERAVGRPSSYLAVLGLTLGMGWKPIPPSDKGIDAITRELPGGLVARLAITPGLLFGAAKGRPAQTIGMLTLRTEAGEPAPFETFDALVLSELLRDAMTLA